MDQENQLRCKVLSLLFLMETNVRSWILLAQEIDVWNIIFWVIVKLAIWTGPVISGLSFTMKKSKYIKRLELLCVPEGAQRKWYFGDFCWKMAGASIRISTYMIILTGWKQRKRYH